MNVLENYIVNVLSVEPYEDEWTKEFDETFLKIRVVTDCHGNISANETVETEDNWEKIKERGYFLW